MKLKKEYDYRVEKTNTSIKVGRFYTDFKDYMEYHPEASIVEMDTVIGTQGGKGGKCFLTLLFRNSNFMLIYLLSYKKSVYVTKVFDELKKLLGIDEFKRLFEVIVTDNGPEFFDPESIEIDSNTGEKVANLPKGTSFAVLDQDDCYKIASHINSTPRLSLNNQSPYDYALLFLGQKNIDNLKIKKIDYDDIDLSYRLLRK